MKPGQSTFEERLSRINSGEARNASDVVSPKAKLVHEAYKDRRFHFDMLVAGAIAGGIAGLLFASNIGFLFIITLDYLTLYGLILADFKIAGYIAAVVLAPFAFLGTLIFSRTAPRAWQFWTAYLIGVLAANFTDLRYWVETVVIPAFWQFVANYTAASEYL
ncbi:hypothetical protein GCM10007385_12550 [Tateyamaria omphalii]|uniref:hypothetical protein n=1 Tax=Tateyamaria omphalii TaxID=299262 RepID=UPI0016731ABF|nr:hypothetical protein [Tateyamaria omphalii]GGX46467.1 hypothetical protein GCM10007385_12550 [Tateyamaria omphalii]